MATYKIQNGATGINKMLVVNFDKWIELWQMGTARSHNRGRRP